MISKTAPLTLLTIAPLTLTFPFALSTYLFVAHTLSAPQQALGASVLAGGVTALVGLFCVGLVRDVADTLWVCYCIDRESGAVGVGGTGERGERGRVVLEMVSFPLLIILVTAVWTLIAPVVLLVRIRRPTNS